ncbi:hypothetical protein BJY01DRAFT_188812 [Aspergillus pseudoustus]|uniref:Uncharacterized protein n=1 Tax=Aspergillus pseudoustus TaxID=1810923 RepID=A0ABR4JXL7_9EURO
MKVARSRAQQQADAGPILSAEQAKHTSYKRPTPKHVFLPHSRIIVRSIASGAPHPTIFRETAANPDEDMVQTIEPDSIGGMEASCGNTPGLTCDPADILQALHQYTRLGQSLEDGTDSAL